MRLATWPWSGSEAIVDYILIQISLIFYEDHVVLMLVGLDLHMNSTEACIKAMLTSS